MLFADEQYRDAAEQAQREYEEGHSGFTLELDLNMESPPWLEGAPPTQRMPSLVLRNPEKVRVGHTQTRIAMLVKSLTMCTC